VQAAYCVNLHQASSAGTQAGGDHSWSFAESGMESRRDRYPTSKSDGTKRLTWLSNNSITEEI
jgi:hypothetical protein